MDYIHDPFRLWNIENDDQEMPTKMGQESAEKNQGDSRCYPPTGLELSGHPGIMALDMEYEYFLRCLYNLLKCIASVPEAYQALCKGWSSFKEFLSSLEYPDVHEEAPQLLVQNATITPPCGTLYINVFDPVNVSVSLTGLEMRAN